MLVGVDEEQPPYFVVPSPQQAVVMRNKSRTMRGVAALVSGAALLASAVLLAISMGAATWRYNSKTDAGAEVSSEVVQLQAYGQAGYGAYGAGYGAGYGAQPAFGAQAGYGTQGYGAAGQDYAAAYQQVASQAATGYGYQQGQGYGAQAADPYAAYANAYAAAPQPYQGPLEFNGGAGPATVAGTKVVQAGAENVGAGQEWTHEARSEPPPSYATENPPMTVMLYRVQSDKDYPMRNVNLADLPGVLWYLHNEIVGFPDKEYQIRHFSITRIIRYKATIWNPKSFWDAQNRKWAPFVAYNAGKCEGDNCDRYYDWGAVVGCQVADPSVANYKSFKGENPVWVSLPGPCPTHEYGAKSEQCISESPGGDCGLNQLVTGARDCSFSLEEYGEVRLDQLLPLAWDGQSIDFDSFTAMGAQEYDKATDAGTYNSFWDGVHDAGACQQRMLAVAAKFNELYPELMNEVDGMEDIKCDG